MSIIEEVRHLITKKNNGIIQLIIVNLAFFLLLNIAKAYAFFTHTDPSALIQLVGLSPYWESFTRAPWGMVTYMFVQVDVFHLLSNMLWLYWMGQIFENLTSNRLLILTYFGGGILGGIAFVMFGSGSNILASYATLIGSSAAVLAIVVSSAVLAPNYTINVMFFGPVKLKYLALVSFILTSLIDLNENTGGKIAHIGGAIFGLLFAIAFKQKKSTIKVVYKRPISNELYNEIKVSNERRVDQILDKISKSGYDSLNKEEKEFLFKQSGK